MTERGSSSQVRITQLADAAGPNKSPSSSRQMSASTRSNHQSQQEFANLYRVDDAQSVNSLAKWQQNENEREHIVATASKASNSDSFNTYKNDGASATSDIASANENVWSLPSASILAQDLLGKLAALRLHSFVDIENFSGSLAFASSAAIVFTILMVAALIHKVKSRRRSKDVKVGPAGPDIVKRRNSNESCGNDSSFISHSLALQPLGVSTTPTAGGIARKPSRRRSSSESSPPNAAFTACHKRDMAFAKDRRADTLVNAMPPDMGGKYKQRIFFARRHSLTQSTCRALDAALSAESGGGNNVDEEEISISSSAFDLDV